MENFIVSARKYRPASFEMVIGQDSITNTLKSAIKNNHLAQAYLFCGPRGVGKTTCARIFAKTINCINLDEKSEACDKCESCLSFNSLRSFNIHELDAASNNKVEDIRSLNDQVRIPPQIGKYSIYIIDEVHMLSASAFNAFLKTLEEPPSHAIFILATTEKHKIIPTILSRCQIFDFNRIRIEDIVKRLTFVANSEGINAAEEALHVIGQKADGAMRDALSIFDQIVSLSGKNVAYKDVIENLNVLDYEYYFKTIDGALAGDVSSVLLTFNEVLDKGFDGHNFVAGLNSHLRELLICRDESTLRLLEAPPAVIQRYKQQTGRCSADFIFKALEIGSLCDLNFKNVKNPRLHAELSLVKMCRLTSESVSDSEKKKSEPEPLKKEEAEIPLPSKSEIIREDSIPESRRIAAMDQPVHRHDPVLEKPSKSFSIRDVMSDAPGGSDQLTPVHEKSVDDVSNNKKVEFSTVLFEQAWADFISQLNGEGTRIVSMFKAIKPEVENDQTVRIHLSNAAQKDTFVLNYKQRLISFLENRFIMSGVDVETAVDLTEATDILYTDEQKYTHMTNKYPILKDMKKSFNLDLT